MGLTELLRDLPHLTSVGPKAQPQDQAQETTNQPKPQTLNHSGEYRTVPFDQHHGCRVHPVYSKGKEKQPSQIYLQWGRKQISLWGQLFLLKIDTLATQGGTISSCTRESVPETATLGSGERGWGIWETRESQREIQWAVKCQRIKGIGFPWLFLNSLMCWKGYESVKICSLCVRRGFWPFPEQPSWKLHVYIRWIIFNE